MDAGKQRIYISFAMKIDDGGEMEYNTVKETGYLFQKKDMDVIMYQEEIAEGITVQNMITIYLSRVTIKRSGPIEMKQRFLPHKKTEDVYKHPHGNMHMETYTHTLTYDKADESHKGKLSIRYDVQLNQTEKRDHELTLTYEKRDKE